MFTHLDTLDATNLVQVVCFVYHDVDLDVNANYEALTDFARESASVGEDYRIAEVSLSPDAVNVVVYFARD